MHSKKQRSYYRIIPFPENGELRLKSFLNIGYLFMLTPFKVIYNKKRNAYDVTVSQLRKVVSVLRISHILIHLLVDFDNKDVDFQIEFKGPMKLFMSAFIVGGILIALVHLIVINRASTRQQMLQLVNLLSRRNLLIYNSFQFMLDNEVKTTGKRNAPLLVLETYIHYIVLTSTLIAASVSGYITIGFEKTLVFGWNFAANGTGMMTAVVSSYQSLTWWMKVVGFIITCMNIDLGHMMAVGMVLVFFASRTLQDIARHFIANLEASKKFCNISDDEVIVNFRLVHEAVTLISTTFTYVTLFVCTYLMVGCCTMIVLAFTPTTSSFPFTTACLVFYFLWTLIAAADSTVKLRKVCKILQFSSHGRLSNSSWSLRKAIIIYEISSSAVGLRVSDIFIVTYNFMATVLIYVLSNASIVLQSLDQFSTVNRVE